MTIKMRETAPAERRIANIKTAQFQRFLVDGQPLPGHSFLQFDESFPEATGFHIYRMEPGTSSQPHEHTCDEQFLIIEGEVIDNDGTVYKPGDFVLLKEGTQHSSYSETGATLAVFIRSIERSL